MNKSELISELAASKSHQRQADVELIVATIFHQIAAALARGERIELRGFGAFPVKQRTARIGRNPRTGEVVPVDERAVPFFKAGKELRGRLNRGGMKRRTSNHASRRSCGFLSLLFQRSARGFPSRDQNSVSLSDRARQIREG